MISRLAGGNRAIVTHLAHHSSVNKRPSINSIYHKSTILIILFWMECHVKGLLQVLDNKLFIIQKSDKWENFSKEVDIIACFDKRIRCYYIKTRKISQILWNENVKIFFEVRIFILEFNAYCTSTDGKNPKFPFSLHRRCFSFQYVFIVIIKMNYHISTFSIHIVFNIGF